MELINPDSNDPRQIRRGNSVSAMAIASLLVALISSFYLVNTSMIIVPVIAIILAVTALIRIHSVDRLTGAWMALVALFISVFCLTSGIAYKQIRHQFMVQTARKHVEHWCKLAQEGEMYKIHQLSFEYPVRCKPEVDLEEYYDQPKVMKAGQDIFPYMEFEDYTKLEPEVTIRADGLDGELVIGDMIYNDTKSKKELFTFVIEFKRADPSKEDRIFNIQMQRTDHLPPMGPRWSVSAVENIDPPLERAIRRPIPSG